MAYHLKAGESVPEGIRRIASEELASAVEQLSAPGPNRDEAIHEARKSVKKVRAALRLIRGELGGVFPAENARLRNIGRKLSAFRDAGAIIETFDALREKYPEELGATRLEGIRRGLLKRKAQAERARNLGQAMARTAASLRTAGKRVNAWRIDADGFPALAPGLKAAFRAGRRSLARAGKHPGDENFHDLRKRVKDHWYHVRLLERLWTDVMAGYEKTLKDLETWLGDDHNLVVLRGTVAAKPSLYGGAGEVKIFLGLVDKYSKELRENALALGARVYEEKPKQLAKRLKHLWAGWQEQPETLTEYDRGDVAAKPPARRPAAVKRKAPTTAA